MAGTRGTGGSVLDRTGASGTLNPTSSHRVVANQHAVDGGQGMVREFRVGQVFGKSLSSLFSNLIPFMIIGLVVNALLIIYSFWYIESIQTSADHLGLAAHTLISVALGLILSPIQTAAVTFGVFQQLRGQRASLGDCLSAGFSRMLPVIVVAVITGVITLVGLALLVVPGVIFATMFYVAVP